MRHTNLIFGIKLLHIELFRMKQELLKSSLIKKALEPFLLVKNVKNDFSKSMRHTNVTIGARLQ